MLRLCEFFFFPFKSKEKAATAQAHADLMYRSETCHLSLRQSRCSSALSLYMPHPGIFACSWSCDPPLTLCYLFHEEKYGIRLDKMPYTGILNFDSDFDVCYITTPKKETEKRSLNYHFKLQIFC